MSLSDADSHSCGCGLANTSFGGFDGSSRSKERRFVRTIASTHHFNDWISGVFQKRETDE